MALTASEVLKQVQAKYPLPEKDGIWKTVKKDPDFFEAVIESVSAGQSVSTFARTFGLAPTRVCAWLATGLDETQKATYDSAREIRAASMADRILEICDQVETGLLSPQQAKLIVDNLKWIAARLDPHIWGDRIQVKAEVKTTAEMHLDAVRQLSQMVKKREEGVVIEGEHAVRHLPKLEEPEIVE